jgi:hypothetical protein
MSEDTRLNIRQQQRRYLERVVGIKHRFYAVIERRNMVPTTLAGRREWVELEVAHEAECRATLIWGFKVVGLGQDVHRRIRPLKPEFWP